MTEKQLKVLLQAIETYGKANQVDKAIEEMSELTKALLKERQNAGAVGDIIEELADVYIMLAQLAMIYKANPALDDYVEFKIKRLERKLQNPN